MVKVNNLVKNYGDFKLEVSLEIPDGAVTGIIGKNGAGKSTTIKAILGLIEPDGGSITIGGKEVSTLTLADKEKLGVALSDAGFSNYITLKDVICILREMYPTFDESFFRKQCELQKLPLNKKLKDFSTGMRAKSRVLVAISHKANLLVMDEPTSGLDVGARNEVLDLLRDYLAANDECSILLTSHISSDLEGLCDDIYMINDGKVILHEDTDAILGRYGILKADEEAYEKLDKNYILSSKKTGFGYSCITNERQYYLDNYPGIVVENGNIDDLILLMTGGH
ncbi:MAG: ABC transporter ATP-binding protein [Butyrivibrio sp.]|jgi:ABC-2 type transport system ATP-binding protein|uniref:ABC transporter ATP-binding protein n=1 Tax=Butyrivibrio sp. TaxID=28121 RepID=UPI001EB853E2|nr:ABC transporter ATP-binding protein [Butyrivibrio sp.]MBE5842181.1 ABC transporter ATP-binding protein [Butyrivibrio sp.]